MLVDRWFVTVLASIGAIGGICLLKLAQNAEVISDYLIPLFLSH